MEIEKGEKKNRNQAKVLVDDLSVSLIMVFPKKSGQDGPASHPVHPVNPVQKSMALKSIN
jgi:hypothetical protein